MSMVLTLDISAEMGWAICDPVAGTVVDSGVWKFPRRTVKKVQESPHAKLAKFRLKLVEAAAKWPITRMVWEEVEFIGYRLGFAAHHQFLGVVLAFAHERGWSCQGVPVSVHKKYTTGKGGGSKEETMFAVERRFGIRPEDDNHGDALSLAHCVIAGIDLQEPERKKAKKDEKKAIKARRKTKEEKKAAQQEAAKLANIL